MRRRFTQAVLWIAATLCFCALPLAANATSWGGTVLSKGLVYDDVYGVVNGNALMSKVVEETSQGTVVEVDLVRSDGTILFKTGYVEQDGKRAAHDDYAYMPTQNFMNPKSSYDSDFTTWNGGMQFQDAATGAVGFVNNEGKVIAQHADDILSLTSDRYITGNLVDGSIELTLVDANGAVLDTVRAGSGIKYFYGLSKYMDTIEVSANFSGASFNATIENDQIVIHEETSEPSTPTDRTIFDQLGYKVELTTSGDLVFTVPDGSKATIPGHFTYATLAWNNDGTDVGIRAGSATGGSRHFNLDGTEIFQGKGYTFVTRLKGSDTYLCQLEEKDNTTPGSQTRYIMELGNGTVQKLDDANDAHYEVVNGYVVAKESYTSGAITYSSFVTRIIDENGTVVKTFPASDRWHFTTTAALWDPQSNETSFMFARAPYQLVQSIATSEWDYEYVKTRYLDENLQTIAEFDGRINPYAAVNIGNETTYPLFLKAEAPWVPSTLYNRDLEPVTYHGMQRVMANGAAERGDLAYVTDGKGHYGALDASGTAQIPVEFEAICDVGEALDDSTILVKRDGKWYFMQVDESEPEPKPEPQAPEFSDVVAGETPHAEHIAWLAESGVSKGWENGDGTYSFRPYAEVARCDMAAFLYRLAGSPAFEPTAKQRAAFSDVDENTPHAKEVWWLAAQGISAGWDEAGGTKTFRPYETVKRCDMAAFLNRLARNAGKPAGAGSPFTDVADATPHRAAVLWLASNEVSKGWTEPDGTMTFRPYETVKRADMAAFLHRMDEKGLVGEAR